MNSAETVDLLNRLLAVQCRSLAIYLTDASPWTAPADSEAGEVLANIVADQQQMAARIAELVQSRGGALDTGGFPMEFTDLHFLSLDYLIGELIRHEKQGIALIVEIVKELAEQIAAPLHGDPETRELAEETLGSEKAHLEALEELSGALNAVV